MGLFSWLGSMFKSKPAAAASAPALTPADRFEAIKKMLPQVGIPNFNSAQMQDSGMFQFGVTITDEGTRETLNLGFLLSIHPGSMQLRCYGAAKLPPGAPSTALLKEINRINRESLLKVVWNDQDGDVELQVDLLLAGSLPTVEQLGMCLAGPFAILQRERGNLLRACGGGSSVDSL